MTDSQAQAFSVAYRAQRKDPMIFLTFTLVGFVVVGGIGRFYVGTIINVTKYKRITFPVNQLKVQQIASMAKAS